MSLPLIGVQRSSSSNVCSVPSGRSTLTPPLASPSPAQATQPSCPSHHASIGVKQRSYIPAAARRLIGTLTLWTGDTLHVRPIRPSDTTRLRDFLAGLSQTSITFRFFACVRTLPPQELSRLTHVDYRDRMALVATTGVSPHDRIVAVGRYDRISLHSAEIAFTVADAWQQHGLGMALLLLLADYARAHGFTTLVAYVMTENTRMLEVLENAGFPLKTIHSDGQIDVTLDISAPPMGQLAPLVLAADPALHRQRRSPV